LAVELTILGVACGDLHGLYVVAESTYVFRLTFPLG